MLFRPTVEGWNDLPAKLHIERISEVANDFYKDDEFGEAAMARRITFATDYIRYIIEEWAIAFNNRVASTAGGTNVFAVIGKETSGEVGSPTAEYVLASYEVQPDEALVITIPQEPDGTYWSFQIFDVWLRSIAFQTRQTTLHGRNLVRDGDGRIRMVLAHKDPGVANWLDAAGYAKGQILLRNYRSTR